MKENRVNRSTLEAIAAEKIPGGYKGIFPRSVAPDPFILSPLIFLLVHVNY